MMKFQSLKSLVAAAYAGDELTQQRHERAKVAAGKKEFSRNEMAKAITQDEIFKRFLFANLPGITARAMPHGR
jgi:hypothetical protein